MKFKIDIDGKEREVEATAEGMLLVDGERFTARVKSSSIDKRVVQVGDKTFEVRIAKRLEDEEGAPGGYVLEVGGERVPVIVSEVVRQTAPATAGTAVDTVQPSAGVEPGAKARADYKDGIFAPVPGKIVDVRVKPGDMVKEGDLVVILEAMKMENELHAPKQATVAAVLVNKGDQATKGQLLVAFE